MVEVENRNLSKRLLVTILINLIFASLKWRRVRVVEGARLESVYTGNRIASSNLAVSADFFIIFRLIPLLKKPPVVFLPAQQVNPDPVTTLIW